MKPQARLATVESGPSVLSERGWNVGDVIPLVREVSLQTSEDKAALDVAIDVLASNASLARATQDLADVFVRLDRVFAGSPGDAGVRRPIDIVVEQDRKKLLMAMRDLLESISEYTSAVRDGMRCTFDGRADATRR